MSSPTQEGSRMRPFFYDFLSGGVSGIVTVALVQPLLYFKNISQLRAMEMEQSKSLTSFSSKPRVWYKGGGIFAASFAPTVAIQTAANGIFGKHCHPILAAMLAGAFSSIIVSPAELIMIQQQKRGLSMIVAAKSIAKELGFSLFIRGFLPTAMRESVFTGAYLGVTPYLKKKYIEMGMSDGKAHLLAGCISGVFAAIISHPLDTYKSRVQQDFGYDQKFTRLLFTKEAFAGIHWRILMVVVATLVLPYVQEKTAFNKE